MKGYVTFEKIPLKGRDLVCKTSTFKRSVMKKDITSRKKRGRRKRMHLFGPLHTCYVPCLSESQSVIIAHPA